MPDDITSSPEKDMLQRLAALAQSPAVSVSQDAEWDRAVAEVTRIRVKEASGNRRAATYERLRPTGVQLAQLVFKRLGVHAPAVLEAAADELSAMAEDASKMEELMVVGSSIPANSALLQGFRALHDAISDRYGSSLEGEIEQAKHIGSFAVEEAIRGLSRLAENTELPTAS